MQEERGRPATKPRTVITAEARWKMIEEAAYYEAEKRGFTGDAADDWVRAEKLVDAQLAKTNIQVAT